MSWRTKRGYLFVLLMFFCTVFLQPAMTQAASVRVIVNGQQVYFPDVQPLISQDRTLVPIRFIAETPAFGAVCSFDQNTRQITIQRGDRKIVLWPNNRNIYVNGKGTYLDVAPVIKNGRTMVPLRFVSESFGAGVDWNAARRWALITLAMQQKTTLGYYYGDSYSQLVSQHSNLTDVAFHWYETDENGTLIDRTPQSQQQALDFARKNNMRTQASVALFDRQKLNTLLNSKEARAKLIDSLIALAREKNYQVLNIDFESVAPDDKNAYNNFLAELSAALKQTETGLMAAAPALERFAPWSAAYDYAEIAKYVDKLVIMAYDKHWRTGDPGPIAPYDWVTRVISYARQSLPADKIILGLGIYGYDWPDGQPGRALSCRQAEKLAASRKAQVSWRPVYQLPNFTYQDDAGILHQVWYENRESLKLKLDFAKSQGLAGVSIWRIEYGFSEFWTDLEQFKET